MLTLAEVYVISSDYDEARSVIKGIDPMLSSLNSYEKMRFFSVKVVVDDLGEDNLEKIMAGEIAVNRDEARRWVYSYVKKLTGARVNYSGLERRKQNGIQQ